MENKEYEKFIKDKVKKKNKVKNSLMAFFWGGMIALIAQCIYDICSFIPGITKNMNQTLMLIIVIFIASLSTGLGFFDKFANIAGAGSFIPITGFSNALTSSALEGKSEGPIYGIGSNMFKLAGSVLVYGIVASFLTNLIRYFIMLIGG